MHVYRTNIRLYTIATIAVIALTMGAAGCRSTQPTTPAVDDATLSAALQSRIAGDSALSTEGIQSSVQNGVATLNGNVSSEAARSLAAADASQITGIRTVVNNLSVQQPAPAVAAVTPPPVQAPPAAPKRPAAIKTPKPEPAPAAVPIERQPPVVAQQEPTPAPAPAPPPPPPPPAFRNVTIPSGTTIPVRITQTLDSATAQQGQTISGTVATDVMVDGLVAIRQGTGVSGRVSAVQEAAHYKGSSLLSIELTSINRRGETLAVTSDPFTVEGKGRGKNTAAKVGGGAAVGAILGGIFGGGKGAAIGAAAGGGVGAGANTITRGEQVQIPSESLINFHLTNTLAIRVSTSNTLSTQGTNQRRPMNTPQEQPQ
ncbi:MAG TPA: BON domain-containing protein [Edaphobacter sp.]